MDDPRNLPIEASARAANKLSRVLGCDLSPRHRRRWAQQIAVSAASTRDTALIKRAVAALQGLHGQAIGDDGDWSIVRLCALLEGLTLALTGDVAAARHRVILARRFDADALEAVRYEIGFEAALHLGMASVEREAARIAAWHREAPDRTIRCASRTRAQGRLAYWQGRFADAVRHFERAFHNATWVCDRIFGWLNLASSWLELGDHPEARCAALEAQSIAHRSALPSFELRAAWLLRAIAYREGSALLSASDDLVALADQVGMPGGLGAALLLEAAISWRRGALRSGLAYALRAIEHNRGVKTRRLRVLAAALAVACGQEVTLGEFEGRAQGALANGCGEIGLQALALLMQSRAYGLEARPDLLQVMGIEQAARHAFDAIAPERRRLRLDVLSPQEAFLALRLKVNERLEGTTP